MHTPGPWNTAFATEGVMEVEAPHNVICRVFGDATDEIYKNEIQANARLIASAPDLLLALKGLRDMILDTPECRSPDKAERMRNADAAIGKAG